MNTPLPSLFDYLPTAIENNFVKSFIEQHSDVLISFIVNRAHYSKKMEIIGTGFFCYSPDPTVVRIVTAAHTLKDFEGENFGHISIGNKLLPIRDIGARWVNEKADIALWELPSDFFVARKIERIPALPLFDGNSACEVFTPTLSFILFGYPWTRNNEIDIRDKKNASRALFGMAIHGFDFDSKNNEILFRYDYRKVRAEDWAQPMTTAPHLKGMSGCPVIRIIYHKEQKKLAFCLSGVFTNWDKPNRKLRACQFGDPWFEKILG